MTVLKRESAASIHDVKEEKANAFNEMIGLCQKRGVLDTLKTKMIGSVVLGTSPSYIHTDFEIRKKGHS